jgi:hypothetical protein
VAEDAIKDAEHPCGKVTTAVRHPTDGSIIATCSNRERYRVFTMQPINEVVAMRCSAAEKLGVSGCS